MDTSTQQALVQLVEATQLVATRTSLVHAGAPSLLGQLLPTALQLWSQDGLPSRHIPGCKNQGGDTALLRSRSREFSATATRLAAGTSSSGRETMLQHCAAVTAVGAQVPKARSDGDQGRENILMRPRPLEEEQFSTDSAQYRGRGSGCPSPSGHNSQLELSSLRQPSEPDLDICDNIGSLSDCLAMQRLASWDSDASLAQYGRGSKTGQTPTLAPAPDRLHHPMDASDYLTIEEDDTRKDSADDFQDSLDAKSAMSLVSPACQQLLLLLRVLRNLCATGSDATQALAEVGVPAQVAHLVSTCIQSATEGKAQLSKVAAQLLANMSANEGRALHAVWAGCFPGAFADLAALPRDVHGPLCRALLHCCSASSEYAAALCSPSGSPILRRLMLMEASAHTLEDREMVMELGWLMGHLVYVRGLLPELFGALAEVQPLAPVPDQAEASSGGAAAGEGDSAAKARLDPLQCVLLELLSEEMEHGSAGQQLKVLSQGAPGKAERSLLFLVTTVRELGLALAETRGEACLEASVLEAAFQVLKDLYALDDGGASLAAGTNLGGALFRMGLVHLLLAFLLALGPIQPRARAAPGSAAAAAQAPGDAFCASAAASLKSVAAGLPKHPPYLGYRTDIVAVLSHASYKRPIVQKEILRLGGVPLMLSQCQVDDSSPMVREWAMWGLRNLCEGNDAIQQAILDLQPVAPVQNPELAQLGLQVELDPTTGKFSVVRSADVGRSQPTGARQSQKLS